MGLWYLASFAAGATFTAGLALCGAVLVAWQKLCAVFGLLAGGAL